MTLASSSFPPIIGDTPRVLVLGTLPSRVSLQRQQYYGHPQNKFWRILFALHNVEFMEEYSDKVDFAIAHHFAIWDVCHTAIRPGSLDADISQEQPNRIEALLEKHPSISTIAFNGKKAEQLYFKYFKKIEGLRYVSLLSTSPANAAYSLEQKINHWKSLVE